MGSEKKLWIPKVITLVCRKPMYSEMKKYLRTIYERTIASSDIPLENMLKNLIFETTYLRPNYILSSDFWNMKELEYND